MLARFGWLQRRPDWLLTLWPIRTVEQRKKSVLSIDEFYAATLNIRLLEFAEHYNSNVQS